jgi:GTP-binding protein HflX
VLSDTVGFIRDLPHSLVAAFHATLEETARADLLLHVVDAASADRDAQIEAVEASWRRSAPPQVPQLRVYGTRSTPARPRSRSRAGCLW